MRTNEERTGLIRRRTAEIKRERQKRRQRALDVLCTAGCLILVVGIGLMMPQWAGGTGSGVQSVSGAASLVAGHAALYYILMGLLSFLLGVCVTVLLYRLHRRNERAQERKQQESSDDEL